MRGQTRRGGAAATIAAVVLAAMAAACGGGEVSGERGDSITGVVLEVDGSLRGIDGFTVLQQDGTEVVFEPAAGATFGDEGPLSHLFDHLRNGERVEVEYTSDSGSLIATHVGDAG